MRSFNPGDIVCHFKRHMVDNPVTEYLYQIVGIATHSETREQVNNPRLKAEACKSLY